jgi:molybdopterin synthase catalytic subunit
MAARICDGPLETAGLLERVQSGSRGASVLFFGTTRSTPGERAVVALEYEAHPTMAAIVFEQIEEEVAATWPDTRAYVVHRIGRVATGEASVVVATAAPHRKECYAASQYVMNELKRRAPVWKKEIYEDGSAWKANTPTRA